MLNPNARSHARMGSTIILVLTTGLLIPAASAQAEIALVPSVLTSYIPIPGAPYGTYQTAFKPGDTINVLLRSFNDNLQITTDTSALGTPFASVGSARGPYYDSIYGVVSPSVYAYDPSAFTIGAVSDGLKEIVFNATDPFGNATTSRLSVVVDTIAPEISITDITFSTTTPQDGDYMYLSGAFDGTGSAARLSQVYSIGSDENGANVSGCGSAQVNFDSSALRAAIGASSSGTFENVPARILECEPGYMKAHGATNFTVVLDAYDEAGNTAHAAHTVPYPRLAPAPAGVSNVLFLPGIEGSRLYEGTGCGASSEEKLWEPYGSISGVVAGVGDGKARKLALDEDGESACSDIYAKSGDVLDSIGGTSYYGPFIDQMNQLKSDGTINDWEAGAYDWRLSLDELLSKGREVNGKINYGDATTSPYIEQELERLAADSQTGKVTIVAHSNGGLVAKALMQKLEAEGKSDLVDRIIMVAVPQTGAPVGIGSLLIGLDAGIYYHQIPIVSNAAARALALNSPMAYHLLPSEDYLESAVDLNHPVIKFSGNAYASEEASYGTTIRNRTSLDDFILAAGNTRTQPASNDLTNLAVGNPSLVDYANRIHAALDSWVPPPGIEVDQIAGWGANSTIAGVDFYTSVRRLVSVPGFTTMPVRKYRPVFTEDGDGTVPVPSALAMGESENVKRYWLDLTNTNIKHATIFTSSDLRNFINLLITGSESPVQTISTSAPVSLNSHNLIFILHSPLTLELSDSSGNITGSNLNGTVSQNIPGAEYGTFGETQYIIAPAGQQYSLGMAGLGSGTFSLDVEEYAGGKIIASSTIADVPVATSTMVHMTINDGITSASPLTVDEDGDGNTDFSIAPAVGTTTSFDSAIDPLAYIAYMQKSVAALHLSAPVTHQLNAKLQNLVHLIKQDNRWDKGDDDQRISLRRGELLDRIVLLKINQLERYVKLQEALGRARGPFWRWIKNAQQGIAPENVSKLLAMIEELKLLASQKLQ